MLIIETPETVPYSVGWDFVPFYGNEVKPVGFDTETDLFDSDSHEHPKLALWSASDGERTVLGHPAHISRFVRSHVETPLVFHNVGFDFWVVERALREVGDTEAIKIWWNKVDRGDMHDTMILDALLRLAQGRGESFEEEDDGFYMRNLGDVAKEYAKIEVNKRDPYRKRYGEIIGKSFSEIADKGFWDYAATDPYATALSWRVLYSQSRLLVQKYANSLRSTTGGRDRFKSWLRYGLLTEQIQVKGSIALAKVERNGFAFDSTKARLDEEKHRARANELVEIINKSRPDFFKKKKGLYERSKKSLLPSINNYDLVLLLGDVVEKVIKDMPGFQAPQSTGKQQGISKSADDWIAYKKYDPILEAWTELVAINKRLGFHDIFRSKPKTLFSMFEPEPECVIRCRYNLLMRTGRTSCSSPNLQQIPKDSENAFRSIFIARPGYKFVVIDYSAIELGTLAATCIDRFGYSKLGEVITKGIDPHAYTASSILGMKYEDFMELKKTDPDRYKDARQKAKPVNFGYPGGLGAAKFVTFAQAQYGVSFTLHEAEKFREKLIEDVYPELNSTTGYLADETIRSIAINSGLTVPEVETAFGMGEDNRTWIGRVIERIAKGGTCKSNGESYNGPFLEKIQAGLKTIGFLSPKGALSEKTRKRLIDGVFEPSVGSELCNSSAISLTGRIRSKVVYTKLKNTPFQGLASDGGKMALYKLTRLGYRIVAFIHDELILEVPEATCESDAKIIESIMCSEMQSLFDCSVPVRAEYAISDHWTK